MKNYSLPGLMLYPRSGDRRIFFLFSLFLVVVFPGKGYSMIKDVSKESTSHIWGKRAEQLGKNIGG